MSRFSQPTAEEAIRIKALEAATVFCSQYTPTKCVVRTAATFEEYILKGFNTPKKECPKVEGSLR